MLSHFLIISRMSFLPHSVNVMKVVKMWIIYSPDRDSKGVNFRNFDFLPGISIYGPPNLRNLKNDLELSDNFSNIALILSNLCRFQVNSYFFVRLFHPPQFIIIPSQLFRPPTIRVGRVPYRKKWSVWKIVGLIFSRSKFYSLANINKGFENFSRYFRPTYR